MKIYITYNSAGALWSSGLQCVFVWFCKPTFMFRTYTKEELEDSTFGQLSDKNGLREYGWTVPTFNQKMWLNNSMSFGSMFGYGDRVNQYENEIVEYVWIKINEHFKNKPFGEEWKKLEDSGEVLAKDFLLELEINIHITQSK